MNKRATVLLVEDSPSLAEMYRQYLKKDALNLLITESGEQAKSLIEQKQPDLVLLDLVLPDIPGEEILAYIKKRQLDCAVIVITAHGSVDRAVELMQLGAKDFLQKPIDATRLLTTVRNTLEHVRLKALVSNISESLDRNQYHGFIGGSLAMQAVYHIIESAARSTATIFITGESGTGKEVCAEAIHKQSLRSDQPFVPINCAAIPKDLMESEIFGHAKGAFTGAVSERKGAASQADGGTLFLDEIGEMDLELQTKLLRFVQSGIIKKVGGSREERVDVRFICATNRSPLDEVREGRFREDLYYRLNVIPITLPALRERDHDIILLARHFLKKYAAEDGKNFRDFSQEVLGVLKSYDWPGNVRQLQNCIRNIVVLHNGTEVENKHLPAPLSAYSSPSPTSQTLHSATHPSPKPIAGTHSPPHFVKPLALVERETIEAAIALCNGNIPKAAALLEVSPSTIYRKKQTWEAVG